MENKNEFVKISFLGDIMCEKPLLEASKIGDDEYNFDTIFKQMKDVFKKSDYIVGNLETICAGKEMGYTNHIFSFNTPEEFIKAIKNSGIDLVTTATNHCLDRGVEGLKKNISTLNKYNLKHIGTYSTKHNKEKLFYENFHGIKVAFLNYTYGTNAHINGVVLKENELFHVNLLKPQDEEIKKLEMKQKSKKFKDIVARIIFKLITLEQWIKLKRFLGLRYNKAFQDNSLDGVNSKFLNQIKLDIKKAKSLTDIVIVCIHSGGQFNIEPGLYSKKMMDFMNENGVDVVIGNHPHVVQKHEIYPTGMFGAYSLGNFTISPSSVYLLNEGLPEYSVMIHLYLKRESKKIEKITFSILKIIELEDLSIEVYPIKDLIDKVKSKREKNKIIKDATTIYNRFLKSNKEIVEIKDEYNIEYII